ncbi:MAG TPA: thiamine pyrophosphate-dependent enzyme [Thermomicrobiales bacterium]|nr:thiamine pyrophosphate-dependent enzyme [Thermomicrobiales bacterium]
MPQLTGAQALVKSLEQYGVDIVFGLPGAQLDNIFDALYEERDAIRVIHTRHEQTAAYMAFGYAQATGKVGVCLVVPGPGLLNAGAGICTAYACNAPVLCLAGQIASDQIDAGFGALHEIPDQLGMIRHITKWAARVDTPAEAPAMVREAFHQLRTGRVRPVELEMAPDVMGERAEVTLLAPVAGWPAPELDPDALDRAARLLGAAERPAIVVGGGGMDAGEALRELAEVLQAPVIMTLNGRGALSDKHPLALNPLAGHEIWKDIDAVLAVGTRFDRALDWGTAGLQIVRLDIDPEEALRHGAPDVALIGDARDGLTRLVERVGRYNHQRESRAEEVAAARERAADILFEVQPLQAIAEVIREELPEDGIFVGDVTQIGAYAEIGFPFYAPRTHIGAGYQGTLGYGFATALGAQAAFPDRKVIAACGDGGFMYTMPDLATAHQHKLNLVTLVVNDGAYGNVRSTQQLRYGGRYIASDLVNPDFVKLAESFNIAGRRVESPDALRDALRDALAHDAPALIEYKSAELMPRVRHVTRGQVR